MSVCVCVHVCALACLHPYVALAGLELGYIDPVAILLPLPPKRSDYKCEPPCLANFKESSINIFPLRII